MDDGDDIDIRAACECDTEEAEGDEETEALKDAVAVAFRGGERNDNDAAVENEGVKEVDDVIAEEAETERERPATLGLKRCSARHRAAASAEARSGIETCERAAATAATAEDEAGEAVIPARKGNVKRGGEKVMAARCAGSYDDTGELRGEGDSMAR
jgi:hypothetical protein